MSDPYGYGIANPTEQPVTFTGEVPSPESVGSNDPGISQLKSNADHSHAFVVGGVDTPWTSLSLSAGVSIYGGNGGGFRIPEYTRVGNLCFIRGIVATFTSSGYPFTLATLPPEMCPTYTESGLGFGGGSGAGNIICRLDLQSNGQFVIQAEIGGVGANASTSYLFLGSPYFIYAIN